MGEAVLRDRILKGPRDVRLPDQVVKRLRPVFARENFVAHPKTLAFPESRERRKSEMIGKWKPFRSRCAGFISLVRLGLRPGKEWSGLAANFPAR